MASDDRLVQVHLLGLPVQARTLFSQHLQELTRELSLVQIGAAAHPESSPAPRLLQVAAELNGPYAAFRAEPDATVAAAMAAGRDHCDVTYTVPVSVGAFLTRLGEVLDEADEFCRGQSHLLSLPASQEVVAYRRWFVDESTRQTAGLPPRPWRSAPPSGEAPPTTATATPHRSVGPAAATGPATRVPGPAGEVVGAPLVMESLAGNVTSARRHVREVLRALGRDDLEESAELGVSELVTNAVLHARTTFTLAVRDMPTGRVRIEVADSSPGAIRPRAPAATATTGRGLQLVASLALDWGVEELPAGAGKTVWFEPRAFDSDLEALGHEWALDLDALL